MSETTDKRVSGTHSKLRRAIKSKQTEARQNKYHNRGVSSPNNRLNFDDDG
jgi:hypothetical protein